MFARDFPALVIPASLFTQVCLVIWEVVELIERLQMLLDYSQQCAIRTMREGEEVVKESRNDACNNARILQTSSADGILRM